METSTADLKSLTHARQNLIRDFRSKAALEIIELLVPFAFRSSFARMRSRITNFGKRVLETWALRLLTHPLAWTLMALAASSIGLYRDLR